MRINILTMLPSAFNGFFEQPQIRRAVDKNAVEIHLVDIRDFAGGSYRHIDDSPFGGGAGMLIRAAPIIDALLSVRKSDTKVILFSPSGNLYSQKKAREFSGVEDLVLICGRYEGIDARVMEYVDEVISIGDYVMSGGEIAAMAVCDSVIRLLPGILKEESLKEESFENGLLEYPQYTQPADLNGSRVPEVLLSGNHEAIRRWRLEKSLEITGKYRPDLLENRNFTAEEKKILDRM